MDTTKFKEIKYSNFLVAGIASIGATVFTNPLEVRILQSFLIEKIKSSLDSKL